MESMLKLSFTMATISSPLHPLFSLLMVVYQAFPARIAQRKIVHSTHISTFGGLQKPPSLFHEKEKNEKGKEKRLKNLTFTANCCNNE